MLIQGEDIAEAAKFMRGTWRDIDRLGEERGLWGPVDMKVTQLGAPSVCLSLSATPAGTAEAPGFVAINVPIKIEDRDVEDPAPRARLRSSGGGLLTGKVIEKRPSGGWLLFRVPRDLCQDGRVLIIDASLEDVILWEKAYRVVWRERFPGLELVP